MTESLPVLRILLPAPPHAQRKAKIAQLEDPGGVGGVARPYIRCEIIRETELMLARAWKRHRIVSPVLSKEMRLLSVRTKTRQESRLEAEEKRRKENMPA